MDSTWEVARWVLIVLATGFVAYLGRRCAQWLIDRRQARDRSAGAPPDSGLVPRDPKTQAKREKKRLKALEKAEKKRVKESL